MWKREDITVRVIYSFEYMLKFRLSPFNLAENQNYCQNIVAVQNQRF